MLFVKCLCNRTLLCSSLTDLRTSMLRRETFFPHLAPIPRSVVLPPGYHHFHIRPKGVRDENTASPGDPLRCVFYFIRVSNVLETLLHPHENDVRHTHDGSVISFCMMGKCICWHPKP